jgi:hypothetical protein
MFQENTIPGFINYLYDAISVHRPGLRGHKISQSFSTSLGKHGQLLLVKKADKRKKGVQRVKDSADCKIIND